MRHIVLYWFFLLTAILILVFLVFGTTAMAQTGPYKILNFDKLIVGTDKMIYMVPPLGKYWIVLQGSTQIEQPIPDSTFSLWLENSPYAPYRDPVTGEMRGCERCVTLTQISAATTTFFPFSGTIQNTLLVSYPNRLMAAISPPHGGFAEPIKTWTRIAVIEADLP